MTQYPGANLVLLKDHSAPGTIQQRDVIVLHITEGSTASGALSTFTSSRSPNRVSAHFLIDRDGTVDQLLDVADTAWHASQVNARSVGIEHVALSEAGATKLNRRALPATEQQYGASAALVAWLCKLLSIPCDRQHVKTHFEASPKDGHVQCCTGALNPDRVVQLAASLLMEN